MLFMRFLLNILKLNFPTYDWFCADRSQFRATSGAESSLFTFLPSLLYYKFHHLKVFTAMNYKCSLKTTVVSRNTGNIILTWESKDLATNTKYYLLLISKAKQYLLVTITGAILDFSAVLTACLWKTRISPRTSCER